ncbi:ABC transporter substrate-binding protein [Nitrospirillum sp. BR 11828]|uniref:ABC transporter substrate-binding protein n=1 Tax=Nitrospirillum sp. BR 11828 TaxID=3104325 RepID=UPI002ACAE7C3|nr:ABC transporter substrate-binding protein [Nitrospirillum sp. BR 11828]MDZ5648608.1 ABC transporter substrate-binding protein [Nitrospirillum sp. BR 11828]
MAWGQDWSRRGFLRAGAGLGAAVAVPALLTGCDDKKAPGVLKVGDQRGGLQALLSAYPDDKPGLDYQVEWAQFPNAAPVIEALNARAIDVGAVGDAPFGFGLASKAQVKALAAYRSSGAGTAILVKGDGPVRAVADLAGHTVATSKGSIGHFLVLRALAEAGVPVDKVTIAFLAPNDAKAALLAGSIDAWATWDPYSALGELHDGLTVLVNAEGRMPGLSYLLSTPTALSQRRALLRDFVGRVNRARDFTRAQPDKYAAVFAEQTGVPAEVALLMIRRTNFQPVVIDDGIIADQQSVVDQFAKVGLGGDGLDVRPAFERSL